MSKCYDIVKPAPAPALKLSPVHVLEGHESLINSCSFSKDGNLVVSSSADGTVRLWHAGSGEQIASFEGHDGTMVQNCAFIPASSKPARKSYILGPSSDSDDSELLEASESDSDDAMEDQPLIISASDEDIKVWGVRDGKEKSTMLIDCEGMLQNFALSPDGTKILSNMDNQCIILSTIGRSKAVTLNGHEGAAKSLCFSADGSTILTSSTDGSVKLWSSESGEELVSYEGHTDSVWKAAFSPDGSRVLSCSADKSLRIWNTKTGRELCVLNGHKSPVHLCAFAPNGRWIASVSKDKEIIVWDAKCGEELARMTGHEAFVWNIEFSPDSMLLLSTASDGTMKMWSLPHGKFLATLNAHTEGVKSCSFSPGGKALASSSHDNSLMLWNISGCHYSSYVETLAVYLDSRLHQVLPFSIVKIISEYTWPDLCTELDIEEDYEPQEELPDYDMGPVHRRRIKSCKF